MSRMKKILSAMIALIMVLSIIPISVSAESTGDPITFEYDFNSEAALSEFNAYYLPVTGYWDNMVGTAEDASAHWELTTVGDYQVVRRANLTAGENPGTGSSNAMLYLPTEYRYFEAEMDFLFGDSWGWAQLCFGAAQEGNHMHNDNAGVYMQQEGHVNLSCPGGNDVQINVEGDFTKAGLHTIKLRVEKGSADDKIKITVWADGTEKIVKEDVYAENFSERSGFISLQAQNDNVAFDNLKITVLNDDGSVATTPAEPEPEPKPQPKPVPNTFFYDFNNANDLKAFSAYHQPIMDYNTNKTGSAVDWTEYWELVTDDDGNTLLQRKNLVAGENPSTSSNNSMLYLNEQKFTYFEAEMTFKFGDSWGWAQLCFGAAEQGNHMHHDNAGVYMQQEGHTNLSCPGGNDAQVNVEGDFTKAGLHTIKVKVVKGSTDKTFLITVWADGVKKIEKEAYAKNFSDRSGWISIQSQNDNIAIDSLKITELDANGNVVYTTNPGTGEDTTLYTMLVATMIVCMAAIVVIAADKKNRFFA